MILKNQLKMVTVLLSTATTLVLFIIYCGIVSIKDPNQNSFCTWLNLEIQLKKILQPTGYKLKLTNTESSWNWKSALLKYQTLHGITVPCGPQWQETLFLCTKSFCILLMLVIHWCLTSTCILHYVLFLWLHQPSVTASLNESTRINTTRISIDRRSLMWNRAEELKEDWCTYL